MSHLNVIMSKAPRWSDIDLQLPAAMPTEVRQSVRRIGSRARHGARVDAAAEWLTGLWPASDGPIPSSLGDAIRSALAASGTPGSACGSAPPGLLRGTPGMPAWRSAIQSALSDRAERDYGAAATDMIEDGTVLVSWCGVGRGLALDPSDPITEHLLACIAADEARAILASLERGEDPVWTEAHALHAQVVASRRKRI